MFSPQREGGKVKRGVVCLPKLLAKPLRMTWNMSRKRRQVMLPLCAVGTRGVWHWEWAGAVSSVQSGALSPHGQPPTPRPGQEKTLHPTEGLGIWCAEEGGPSCPWGLTAAPRAVAESLRRSLCVRRQGAAHVRSIPAALPHRPQEPGT